MQSKKQLITLLFLISITGYHFNEEKDLKNIQFETADLVVDYKTDHGTVYLEAFKSKETNLISQNLDENLIKKFKWLSIGYPNLVRLNSSLSNYIVFHDQGFYFKVNMLTDYQKSKFTDIAKQKYGIDILPSQIISLEPSIFVCYIYFFDENEKIVINGNSLNLNEFPIRVDFLEPTTSYKRQILERKLVKEGNKWEPFIECKFQVNGNTLKTNEFSIEGKQLQEIGLVDKLFGPASSVFVTRDQMSKLTSQIYSEMKIIENYEMTETQFSEKFIEDFIFQTSNMAFKHVNIEEALKSLSKYNLDKDFQPDKVLKEMSKTFKIKSEGNKKHIVTNKENFIGKNNETDSSSSDSFNFGFNSDKFGFNAGSSKTIGNRKAFGSSEQEKSLNDQLNELNQHTQNEVIWEIDGEKVIPKTINVASLLKSKFSSTLSFKRFKNVQFEALFKKSFRLYTSSLSSVVPYDKYFEEIEKFNGLLKNFKRNFYEKLEKSPSFRKGMIIAIATKSVMESFDNLGVGYSDYAGWYLCNGLNNTPNLTGRFLVGLNSENFEYSKIGNIGGLNKVKLDVSQLTSHYHMDEGHSHDINMQSTNDGLHTHLYEDSYSSCCSKGLQHSGSSYRSTNDDLTRYTQ
ncbi:unnamed protein product [Brachionus calyciflorus]|uniref:Uncharacterized protein n=1 Tax=Brachionus calyciflorus TaxID=104777 RepID=A0A814J7J5_9BILA|nr:unnamed protein product [Brachionus calyciflorus]